MNFVKHRNFFAFHILAPLVCSGAHQKLLLLSQTTSWPNSNLSSTIYNKLVLFVHLCNCLHYCLTGFWFFSFIQSTFLILINYHRQSRGNFPCLLPLRQWEPGYFWLGQPRTCSPTTRTLVHSCFTVTMVTIAEAI